MTQYLIKIQKKKVVRLDDEEYAIKKKDENIEKIKESNEDRRGFDLNMPVFERIVCKNTEDSETGNLINTFMYVFFICLIALPLLQMIRYLFFRY